MNYFDLHSDTPFVLHRYNKHLDKNDCHVSLERTEAAFGQYTQIAAYCSPRKRDDESAFLQYQSVTERFKQEIELNSGRAAICLSYADLLEAEAAKKAAFFLSVEDARITAGDLSRVDFLYRNGCRFLTMVWGDDSCIGGAHNTDNGLTDFGIAVARRCFELGIVPDVSHSSAESTEQLLMLAKLSKKPVIATHSNSYHMYPHSRNLRDAHFRKIVALKGIVGVSLCRSHIQEDDSKRTYIDGIVRHIEHYLELGGENYVCFGCDFDGCDLPDGIESISDVHKVLDRLAQLNYPDELLEKLSYNNAKAFIKRNF